MPSADVRAARRRRILDALTGRSLIEAYRRTDIRIDLEAEAADPDADQLVTPDALAQVEELNRELGRPAPTLFFSTDRVILVPGFLASELSDLTGGYGLVWVSPRMYFLERLSRLKLAPYDGTEADAFNWEGVSIEPTGALPYVYDILRGELELRRYTTEVFPVDWRRDLEWSADRLVERVRAAALDRRPIHLLAHSQGALVARRAVQKLGQTDDGRRVLERVKTLVLFGPANYGTFSAAFAIAGTHALLPLLRRLAVEPPAGFQPVLASMTGLYQLLPCDPTRLPWVRDNEAAYRTPVFWNGLADAVRLQKFYGWPLAIDTSFFNDKTRVILGGNGGGLTTPAAVRFEGAELVPGAFTTGDGTVPHANAVLPGVTTYLAEDAEHALMGTYRSVVGAVRDVMAGRTAQLPEVSSYPTAHQDFGAPVPVGRVQPAGAARLFSPRLAAAVGPSAPPAAPAAAAGAPPASLDELIAALHEAARRTGHRVRLNIEVEPVTG